MNSDRFEALIDAIIAIIITIIVLDINLPSSATLSAIWSIRLEFLAYLISFLLCFNFWNNHQKLFGLVNTINHKIIWLGGASMFVLSFLPYLTSIISNNFNNLIPQLLYGLIFILVDSFFLISCHILINLDKENKKLEKEVKIRYKKISLIIAIIIIGMIIGILYYPPVVLYSCFGCLFISWFLSILEYKSLI